MGLLLPASPSLASFLARPYGVTPLGSGRGVRWCGHFEDVAAGASPHKFNCFDIGPPDPNRVIVVISVAEDAQSNFTYDSININGIAMTEQLDVGGSVSVSSAIYSLAWPDGRFANFEVNHSETVANCAIAVWALYGMSATATATVSSVADPTVLTISVSGNGVILAMSIVHAASVVAAWTNLIPTMVNTNIGAEATYSGGHYIASAAETDRAVSCNWNGGTVWCGVAGAFA